MEFKDDGKPKKMTWRFFRPAQKPKPEPSVAPPKIVLIPSTGIPSPTQNTQNAPPHQKPAPTLGSPSQPKRGPISGNQMERGKISGEPESGPCCLCQFYRRSCIKHDTSYLMKMFL